MKISTNYKIQKTIEIRPNDSFVQSVNIKGNNAEIRMTGKNTIYHYVLSDTVLADLLQTAKDNGSIGRFYNSRLRGLSVAKTVLNG